MLSQDSHVPLCSVGHGFSGAVLCRLFEQCIVVCVFVFSVPLWKW